MAHGDSLGAQARCQASERFVTRRASPALYRGARLDANLKPVEAHANTCRLLSRQLDVARSVRAQAMIDRRRDQLELQLTSQLRQTIE
jgi:hypothetical protein